jgi:hypothetical protein
VAIHGTDAQVAGGRFLSGKPSPVGPGRLGNHTPPMTKSNEAIGEIIRNPKHSFRKSDDRPLKAQKHRYERRKVKEYIKQSDWENGS